MRIEGEFKVLWNNPPGAATPGDCVRACPPVVGEEEKTLSTFSATEAAIETLLSEGTPVDLNTPGAVNEGNIIAVVTNDQTMTGNARNREVLVGRVRMAYRFTPNHRVFVREQTRVYHDFDLGEEVYPDMALVVCFEPDGLCVKFEHGNDVEDQKVVDVCRQAPITLYHDRESGRWVGGSVYQVGGELHKTIKSEYVPSGVSSLTSEQIQGL